MCKNGTESHPMIHRLIPPPRLLRKLARCLAAGSQPHPRLFTSNLKNPHQFRSSSNHGASRTLAPSPALWLKAKMGQGLPRVDVRRRRRHPRSLGRSPSPPASLRVKKCRVPDYDDDGGYDDATSLRLRMPSPFRSTLRSPPTPIPLFSTPTARRGSLRQNEGPIDRPTDRPGGREAASPRARMPNALPGLKSGME